LGDASEWGNTLLHYSTWPKISFFSKQDFFYLNHSLTILKDWPILVKITFYFFFLDLNLKNSYHRLLDQSFLSDLKKYYKLVQVISAIKGEKITKKFLRIQLN